MSMIFPGMDPYLEDPDLWPGVHSSLIVYIRDRLQPGLRPRYVAAIEERVYVEGRDRHTRPDVSVRKVRPGRGEGGMATAVVEADAPTVVRARLEPIHESFVAILDLRDGHRVVTVIEVVSPTNKYAGVGRNSYLAKQGEILAGDVHLVEIDLLRQGPHVLAVPGELAREEGPYDYLTCVNRAGEFREAFELYTRRLRDRLPRVRIPLADDDPDVALDIQAVLSHAYETGGFRDRIDYARPCKPPLSPEDQAWADALVREAEVRGESVPAPGP